jgi:hypothetical protein
MADVVIRFLCLSACALQGVGLIVVLSFSKGLRILMSLIRKGQVPVLLSFVAVLFGSLWAEE